MKRMIYKSGVILALWLVFTNQVYSQQVETPYVYVPSTVSQEAQAFLRALPDPNLGPAFPDPDEIQKWTAAQQAAKARNLEMQKVKLDLYEGMSHVFQTFMPETPESKMTLGKVDVFIKQHLGK